MRVQLNQLPGLEKVSDGYFWDTVEAALYSNKLGYMVRLGGSVQGGVRRYTVQFKRQHKMWENHALNLRKDEIERKVRATGVVSNTLVENKTTKTTKAGTMQGWIIGSVNGGALCVASNPKVHDTEASVNAEVERLAKVYPGRMIVKMKIDGAAVAGGVQWL